MIVLQYEYGNGTTRNQRKGTAMNGTEAETAIVAVTARARPICEDRDNGPQRLLEAFLRRRSEATRRAYATDLRDFSDYLEVRTPAEAVASLIARGPGPANETALNYKAALIDRGLSAGTVNRRLSTLRSVLKMARTIGMATFALEVENEKAENYRDTRGPGLDAIRAMVGKLEARADRGNRQAVRDLAIVRLLFNLGLRRGEVATLDLEHYDRDGCRLSIKGKCRVEREWIELDKVPTVTTALERWIAERGDAPGPMFLQLDRLAKQRQGDGRISTMAIWRMLRRFGIRPHGLRHSAITTVAERNGGDVFKTMAFSRHKSADVVTKYVDNLRDDAGEMAGLLEDVA